MRNKFTVIDLVKNTTKEFKNIKCISKAYPDIEYHQLYQIYLQTTGRTKRKQQPNNDIAKLYQTLRIHDNEINIKQIDEEAEAAHGF